MEKQNRRKEREKRGIKEKIGESKRTNQPRKRTENTTRMKTNKHTAVRDKRSEKRGKTCKA